MTYFVHVATMVIRRNKVTGDRNPPVIVRRGRTGLSTRGHRIDILDADGRVAAAVVYHPDRPLPCGAVVTCQCPYGARVARQDEASVTQSGCSISRETGA